MSDTLLSSLASGCLLGLSAGAAPGPLLTLMLTETLTCGGRAGLRVAFSPLITDPPIILAMVFLLEWLSGNNIIFAVIALLGAAFVCKLAVETWTATPPDIETPREPSHSLRKGILTNLLNPHPYLFWLTVGAPLLLKGWSQGTTGPLLFLAAFYGSLVGSKIIITLATAQSRAFLTGRAYSLLLKGLALALALFACLFLHDAWNILSQ